MSEINFGDAVLVIGSSHGLQYSGRIGMAVSQTEAGVWTVQFGASGPFARIKKNSLRHALLAEVEAAGMYGTGFNIIDEEEIEK
jgi:hypothetical protein